VYFNMSTGPGEQRGPWNQGGKWDFVSDPEKQLAVDGGDGGAAVDMDKDDLEVVQQMAVRTASHTDSDPLTGAELGMGMMPNDQSDGASAKPLTH
jgi:Mn-containing catalase